MIKILFQIVIGVDIAKKKFDVALFSNAKYKHKTFTNDLLGFTTFVTWFIALCGETKPLICMEATGSYSLPLADFLVSQGYAVSMVNPAKINAFAKKELSRAKTDKADAKLIARYAHTIQPPLWIPPPANIRQLQARIRRAEQLLEMIQMEENHVATAGSSVKTSITAVLDKLEAELKATREVIKQHINDDPELNAKRDLLITIPGVGDTTIAHLWVALSEHHGFDSAKQVVAFAGLAPNLRESGQWRGNTHIAKTGDPTFRKALYMPALSAWKSNPLICVFCLRLKANGKSGKAIACAAMCKLIHLAFAILKSGKPFDPNYAV